jgi:signal transduction histidine kinase
MNQTDTNLEALRRIVSQVRLFREDPNNLYKGAYSPELTHYLKQRLETQEVIRITAKELTSPAAQSYGDLSGERSYWELTIADNGIGFDPLYSQQIFTIFQRLHDQKEYTGTGIGLALCKKIVENQRGYIGASSQPGQGATFTVVLPM